jgi:3-hydroxybutyrate dehydrogenase
MEPLDNRHWRYRNLSLTLAAKFDRSARETVMNIALKSKGLLSTEILEAAEFGVACNAVCPGYVYTPLVEAQIDDQARVHGIPREQVIRDVLLAQQPNKRFATVQELDALAVFLASDAAAASITGAALPVDGGWTAH